jgi:hypothetical protein
MLNHNLVFQHSDLSAITSLANQHLAINILTASQELLLGDDGATTAGEVAWSAVITISTISTIAITVTASITIAITVAVIARWTISPSR